MANVDISLITLANTFNDWRVITNSLTTDRNTLRNSPYVKDNSDFILANGSVIVSNGSISIARTTGGETFYNANDARIGQNTTTNKLFVTNDSFLQSNVYITSATGTLFANNNVSTRNLTSNVAIYAANVSANGFLYVAGNTAGPGGAILNVNSFFTISTTGSGVFANNLTVQNTIFATKSTGVGLNITANATIGGYLGVGTPNPSYNLDVYNNSGSVNAAIRGISGTPSLIFDNGTSTSNINYTSAGGVANLNLNISGASALSLSSTGNNGIGIATPLYKLHVSGGSAAIEYSGRSRLLINPGVSTTGAYTLVSAQKQSDSSANELRVSGNIFSIYTGTVSQVESLRVDATGNVGIGTSSANTAFAVKTRSSPNVAMQVLDNSDTTGLFLGSSTSGNYKYISGDSYYFSGTNWKSTSTNSSIISLSNGAFYLYTDTGLTAGNNFTPTPRMFIDSNGKVGIGTSSAGAKVSIKSGTIALGDYTTYAFSVGNSSQDDLSFGSDSANSYIQTFSSKRLVLNNQGNDIVLNGGYVYVGNYTGSTSYKLQVTGSAYASTAFYAPKFYDSDDTNYYIDPNSTSNIKALNIDGLLTLSLAQGNGTAGPSHPLWAFLKPLGNKLYVDEDFKDSTNGINVYNNTSTPTGSNPVVTITRKNSGFMDGSYAIPNSSGYALEIHHTGSVTYYNTLTYPGSSPGWGGWYFGTQSSAGRKLLCTFRMKIPVGRTVNFASNGFGQTGGGQSGWLTSNAGTGFYQDYAYYVVCGTSGTFETTMFFYIADGSTTDFYTYLASATVHDVTDVSSDSFRKITSNTANIGVISPISFGGSSPFIQIDGSDSTYGIYPNGTLKVRSITYDSSVSNGPQIVSSDSLQLRSGSSTDSSGYFRVNRGVASKNAAVRFLPGASANVWQVTADDSTGTYYTILSAANLDNSITSTSTINVATSQAVSTAYTQASNAYAAANTGANTVQVSQNSGSTLYNRSLNFVNTATMNVTVTAGATGVANIAFFANTTALGISVGSQSTQASQGYQGYQGYQGTQGIQGVQGMQGLQGLQGLQGIQGLQGLQGRQGTQGLQGIQGIGYSGVTLSGSTLWTATGATLTPNTLGAFQTGDIVRLTDPLTMNYFEGVIAYTNSNPLTMSFSFTYVSPWASGSCSSFNLSLAGARGSQGISGSSGSATLQGTQYTIPKFNTASSLGNGSLTDDATGVVKYNGLEIGWRKVPISSQGASYTTTSGDVGKCVTITGSVTLGSGYSAGDAITIYNTSSNIINITSTITLRLAGTGTSGSTRSLASYGIATILFISSSEAVVSGMGVA